MRDRSLHSARTIAFVASLLSSCQAQADTVAPLPASVPVVEVEMAEYRFEHRPTAPAGRLVFRARNGGREEHELTLVRLPDDFTASIDSVRSGATPPQGFAPTAILYARPPGATGTFAIDAAPGRYALLCFVKVDEATLHYDKGMTSELRVT